jgi:anaerobic dimethyl sulfoxide reductase subunit A
VKTRINNCELWDAVVSGTYTKGYQDKQNINIQFIMHDGSSALNQKVGMTRGIEAHRKVEFVLSINFNMNTNCKYADVVLPATTMWERPGLLRNNRDHVIYARQVVEPIFEAKEDDWIAAEIGKRLGLDPKNIYPTSMEQQVYNQLKGAWVVNADTLEREPLLTITAEEIKALGAEGEPQEGRIPLAEFKEKGVYTVERYPNDKYTYIAHKAFREDPEANPLDTTSGKLEIYCPEIVEFVKNSGFTEIRPIPTYNRAVEGYEDTFADWKTKEKGEYPLQLFTIHYRRRSHSMLDSVTWLRELYPQEFIINPLDAAPRGLKTGDIAKIWSRHGTVIRPVYVTERMMPGVVSLGEGAWAEIDEATGIDIAGATNTLNGAIPTGQGHQGWNTCNVQVERYGGPEALARDVDWAPRVPVKEA